MHNFKLTTDSCCDEYKSILKQEEIGCLQMPFITDDQRYDDYSNNEEYKYFYDEMRRGVLPTTASMSIAEIEEFFENIVLNENKSILHLCLSSGLSVMYENTVKAAQNVMERYPDCEILVPDIKAATQGQNLLLQVAKDLRNQEKTAKAASEYLCSIQNNLQHWFFITDLMHLKRGGRISAVAATVGTLLKARPVLTIDDSGKLQIIEKAIGTKKAIKSLVSKVEDYALDVNNQTIYICHSDDMHCAEILKQYIVKHFSRAKVIINYIGPVIGSHTGPDTIGIVFMGKERVSFSGKRKRKEKIVEEEIDEEN